jgi:hypothetical protein
MLDRYLINSDVNAMEIAYLGHNLKQQTTRNAEDFYYQKLTLEQRKDFNIKAATEYNFMWGALPPTSEHTGGRIRWLLRAQQMEQVYGSQIYRNQQQTQAETQTKTDPSKQSQTQAKPPSHLSLVSFKQKLSQNAQQRLQSNYNRLDSDLKDFRNLSPNNPKWQQLRQLSQQDQQLVRSISD